MPRSARTVPDRAVGDELARTVLSLASPGNLGGNQLDVGGVAGHCSTGPTTVASAIWLITVGEPVRFPFCPVHCAVPLPKPARTGGQGRRQGQKVMGQALGPGGWP